MIKNSLEEIVKKYCIEKNIVQKGDRILLAVSGGPDSKALLHVFSNLKQELSIEIGVVHVEHGLRGRESIEDQEFVRKSAEKLGFPFFTENIDVKKLKSKKESIEEGSRRLRYEIFFRVLEKEGYNKIATGHTRDDNVETIIYRLVSGTGPSGLVGIHPSEHMIIHPLLCISKEDILSYLKENGINYRVDCTNRDLSIIRNRIRLIIIPELRIINPRFDEHILNLAKIIKEENQLIETQVEEIIKSICIDMQKEKIAVDYDSFKLFPVAIRRRVIIKLVEKMTETLWGYPHYLPFSTLENIANSKYNGNKILYNNKLISIKKEYNSLIINKRVVDQHKSEYLYFIDKLEGSVSLNEIGKIVSFYVKRKVDRYKKGRLYIDISKICLPIIVRNKKRGDRIVLSNLGTKKLKDIFIDDKVPPVLRGKVPIIVSGEEIAGIFCSFYGRADRISEKYKVTPETERILVCELN